MISLIRRLIHSKIGLGVAFLLLALAAFAFAAGDITGGGGQLGGSMGNGLQDDAHELVKDCQYGRSRQGS